VKAYEATYTAKGKDAEVVLVGANSMTAAAKKAEDVEGKELVKLELTEKVIL
jgi:hypothetical protein